jgi:lysozyme family protein
MAKFTISHGKTAINEGGYTDNADDSGNWTGGKKGVGKLVGTMYGISAPVLSRHLGRPLTIEDMKNLDQKVAHEIYERDYWKKIKGDQIKSQAAADSLYDSAVNMGPATAIKLAQAALKIAVTGIMDEATLKAINNTKK